MKAEKIPEQEKKFTDTLTNSSGTKYTLDKITVLDKCEIHHIRPSFDSYYYKEVVDKKKIVLHFTVGTIRGDMASLTKKDNHMSVSYVIARNGIIYELFEPKYWSYHLGRGSVGGNGYNSKESIGIELSNYGPLNEVGSNLESVYSEVEYTDSKGQKKKTKKDIYCSTSEIQYFKRAPLRGYDYFASFTDKQLLATKELVNYLSKKFNIPKTLLDEKDRYNIFSSSTKAKEFKGICTHINFRSSGKWDIGSHFDWEIFEDKKPEPVKEIKKEPVVVEEIRPIYTKDDKPDYDIPAKQDNKSSKWAMIMKVVTFILGFIKKLKKK